MVERFQKQDGGCCGVYAIAVATGYPFGTVMELGRKLLNKRLSWQGSTNAIQRKVLANALGFGIKVVEGFNGSTLLEAAWPGRLDPDTFYICTVPGHIVVIQGGHLVDQGADVPAYLHRSRNCRIEHIWELEGERLAPDADDLI